MEEISSEELGRILKRQPREGIYCLECRAYLGGCDDCAPFESTREEAAKLSLEYITRYFQIDSCPYFEPKKK